MSKILVTGAAGFIGSHFVSLLLEKGHEVIAVDNFDPYYSPNIKLDNIARHVEHPNYELARVCITDRDAMQDVFETTQPDIVVHLAARAGVRPSVQDPSGYVQTNINGTINMLDLSVKHNISKFVFASSSSVYGLNEKVPFAETDALLKPASPYGASKLSGEALCNSYNNCYGLPITALRFFTVYGPGQRPDLAIHKFSRSILEGRPIRLFGDGTTSRDYTFISDIVEGIYRALELDHQGYEVFNLGNDQPTKLVELVNQLESIIGKKAEIIWEPNQVGDVPRTWADLTKSKAYLGYEPKVDMQEGLERFVEWLRDQMVSDQAKVV